MLSDPSNGKSCLQLFDFEKTVNHYGHGPLQWLEACRFALTNKAPVTLSLCSGEEDTGFIISNEHCTYIVCDGKVTEYGKYNYLDLTEELITDIRKDFDSWIISWIADDPSFSFDGAEIGLNLMPGPENEQIAEKCLREAVWKAESAWVNLKYANRKPLNLCSVVPVDV